MIRRIIAVLAIALAPFTAPIAAGAAEIGEDGLHKQPWFQTTFKDMSEDLESANAAGKRFAVIFEQRGCTYCKQMHEEVFSDPEVAQFIIDNYYVVQMNLFGDEEVTDFDGEALPEKDMARRWGVIFTPTIMFFPEAVEEGRTANAAAVAVMPGAFGFQTTLDMFTWVNEKRYELDNGEDFQRYHARMIKERQQNGSD